MYKGNYLKGLKGLTKKERADWEKQYQSVLLGKNYSEDEKNLIYLNTQFEKAFGNMSNFDLLKSLDYNTRNEYLELYNRNAAFELTFGKLNNFEKLKELPYLVRNKLLDDKYILDFALKKYAEDPNIADIMSLEPENIEKLIDSGRYLDKKEINAVATKERKRDIGNKFGVLYYGVGTPIPQTPIYDEETLIKNNKEYLEKLQVEDDELKRKRVEPLALKKYLELMKKYDSGNKVDFLFDYTKFAENSPHYHAFKNNYTLYDKTLKGQLLKDYATWKALQELYGDYSAVRFMDRDFQKTIDDKLHLGDRALNTAKNIALGTAADLAADVMFFKINYILATLGKEAAALYMLGKNPDGTKIKNPYNDPTYWQGVDLFNTWDEREIEDIRSHGGISPYNNVYAPGTEYDLLSLRTVDEVAKQSKHMLSGVIEGGVGGALASVIGKGVSLVSKTAGKYVGKALHGAAYLNQGAGNAELEGLASFLEARLAAIEKIDGIINSEEGLAEINKYVERRRLALLKLAGEKGSYIFDEEQERKNGEALYRDILTKEAERDAVDAWTATATIDFARAAATNFALKKYLLSKETREELGLMTKPKTIMGEDGLAKVEEIPTWWKYALLVKYPWDEFLEEVMDNAVNKFGLGLALAEFNDYARKTMNPEAYVAATDNLLYHFLLATGSAMEAFSDPSSYYEGAIGALSGIFGFTPKLSGMGKALLATTKEGRAKLKEEMKDLSWAEKIDMFITNPIISDLAEKNSAYRAAKRNVDAKNKVLVDNKEALQNIASTISAISSIDNALLDQDLARAKDNKESSLIMTLLLIGAFSNDKVMSQSPIVQEAMESINRLAEGNITLDDIDTFLGQPSNKSIRELNDAEQKATERIQKNALKALLTIENVLKTYDTIEKHDKAKYLSQEAKDQLALIGALNTSGERRVKEMLDELSTIGIKPSDSSLRNPLALYLTKTAYVAEKKALEKLLESIQGRQLKIDEKIEETKLKLKSAKKDEKGRLLAEVRAWELQKKDLGVRERSIKEELDLINKDASLFEENTEKIGVITEELMNNLSLQELVTMLDPRNRKNYSQKQLDIIDSFILKKKVLLPDFLRTVGDAYRKQRENEWGVKAFNNIIENPELFDYYLLLAGDDYYNKVNNKFKELKYQRAAESLNATSDLDLFKEAINYHSSTLDRYALENPNRASIIERAKPVALLRLDAVSIINNMDIPSDFKQALMMSVVNITQDSVNKDLAINNLEDAIDSLEVDDNTKLALNILLDKMLLLLYSRNETKVYNRKVQKSRLEAIKNALEKRRKRKLELAKKELLEALDALRKFDIPQEEADAIDGDIIGISNITEPTDDANGRATLKVKKDNKVTTKDVTLTKKNLPQQPPQSNTLNTTLNNTLDNTQSNTLSNALSNTQNNALGDNQPTSNGENLIPKDLKPAAEDGDLIGPNGEGAIPVSDTPIKEPNGEDLVEGSLLDVNLDEGLTAEIESLNSPTIEEQLAELSDELREKVIVTENPPRDMSEESTSNPNDETLKGNVFYGYDGNTLRTQGKQVPNRGRLDNDTLNTVLNFLSSIGARVLDIIDLELDKIIKVLPNILFLIVNNTGGNPLSKDPLNNTVFNVVEYTDEVRRIHNEDLGGVIEALGKKYLIVGTLGFNKGNAALMDNFLKVLNTLKRNRKDSNNNMSMYYVSPSMSTLVAKIGRGWLTRLLESDDGESIRTISDLLGDKQRNPEGLTYEDLKWDIEMYSKHASVNVSSRNKVRYPLDLINAGNTFLLVKAANGNLIPVKILPKRFNELSEDTRLYLLLNGIINNQLTSAKHSERLKAVLELRHYLYMNSDPNLGRVINILIGTDKRNEISIDVGGVIVFNSPIATLDRAALLKAIKDAGFRMNITTNLLSNPEYIKLLDEGGVLTTDVAKLGTSNADYSVYPVGEDGKPIIPLNSSLTQNRVATNSTLARTKTRSIRIEGKYYKYENGKWYGYPQGKLTEVTDKATLDKIAYISRIRENLLLPNLELGLNETYIFNSDINSPEVIVRNSNTGAIEVLSKEEALQAIDKYNQLLRLKAMDLAAREALNAGLNLEDVTLDEPQAQLKPTPKPLSPLKKETLGGEVDINKTGEKSLAELQLGTQGTTASDIIRSNLDVIYRIGEIYPEVLNMDDFREIEKFLESKGIPTTGITDWEALLQNIKCDKIK